MSEVSNVFNFGVKSYAKPFSYRAYYLIFEVYNLFWSSFAVRIDYHKRLKMPYCGIAFFPPFPAATVN